MTIKINEATYTLLDSTDSMHTVLLVDKWDAKVFQNRQEAADFMAGAVRQQVLDWQHIDGELLRAFGADQD
jgi:hypothetical protein